MQFRQCNNKKSLLLDGEREEIKGKPKFLQVNLRHNKMLITLPTICQWLMETDSSKLYSIIGGNLIQLQTMPKLMGRRQLSIIRNEASRLELGEGEIILLLMEVHQI
jgi:hypothetical protein